MADTVKYYMPCELFNKAILKGAFFNKNYYNNFYPLHISSLILKVKKKNHKICLFLEKKNFHAQLVSTIAKIR